MNVKANMLSEKQVEISKLINGNKIKTKMRKPKVDTESKWEKLVCSPYWNFTILLEALIKMEEYT